MIDIIIPAYNAQKTIEQTLYSIAYQTRSDICKVYIVNDASKKDYSDIVEYFSNFISVKEIKLKENVGPGLARQIGIDNSNSEYIAFIDADDVFSSPYSVDEILKSIGNNDIGATNFVEETKSGFYLKDENYIWLHGKVYRRKFLEKHNIHFNDSRENEDNGFNQYALLSGATTNYVNVKTYIWRNNKTSLTRRNNYRYRYNSVINYVYNINWAIDNAIKNVEYKDKIGDITYMALIFVYYTYLEFYKKKDIIELIKKAKVLYKKYKKYKITEERKIELLEIQFNGYLTDDTKKYLLNPIITFNDFLKLIEKS